MRNWRIWSWMRLRISSGGTGRAPLKNFSNSIWSSRMSRLSWSKVSLRDEARRAATEKAAPAPGSAGWPGR
ncbi:MAG TPA: hypothetical protein DD490_20745 [Acidobacteria bacterium]|nr:hypothetical protein [Acidobacteriota bacterium]